jgi:DNA-binding FadR family transcriptional regulator
MHRFGANNDSSLVSKVCTRLAAMMRSPAFTATDKLPPERILAQKLGVSRTVMREATKRLESQGLLEIRHGSGIRIVNELHRPVCGSLSLAMPAPQERLRQLNEARLLVEPEIARQAAERRSNAHLRALAKSQSDLFNALNNALNTLDAVGTVGKEKAYSQHARILLAVEAGDGDVAAKEMRAHLRHAYADLCKTTKTK